MVVRLNLDNDVTADQDAAHFDLYPCPQVSSLD